MNVGDNRWHSKYICDKCKTVIPYITKKGFRDNFYHHYVSTSNRTAHKDFDLCGNCEKKLRVWLDTKEIQLIEQKIWNDLESLYTLAEKDSAKEWDKDYYIMLGRYDLAREIKDYLDKKRNN